MPGVQTNLVKAKCTVMQIPFVTFQLLRRSLVDEALQKTAEIKNILLIFIC